MRYASPLTVRGGGGGMIDFKGSHFEKEIILWGVRWYVAYPISYRQLEEMTRERGASVDHSTLSRWVIKYAPRVRETVSPLSATSREKLASRRDIRKNQREMGLPLSRGGQRRANRGFFVDATAR
jgi:hypothetical protein